MKPYVVCMVTGLECSECTPVCNSKKLNITKDMFLKEINHNIIVSKEKFGLDIGEISDGYHTFNELYFHRMLLFSIICNTYKDFAWKSWKHHDDSMYKDYFIVGISTLEGDYTYHYHKDFWGYFKVKELDTAPVWDGHKPEDVTRLLSLL